MMEPMRIFFSKTGRAKYISHLDMARCIQRCFKRAGLPIWYTEGFNPHIYLTFALPISLGHESICESMDIRLTEEISVDELIIKLNKALPEGLVASHAVSPVLKPEKITCAEYSISIYVKNKSKEELLKIADKFFNRDTINVMKKTKKLDKEIDLKPLFSVLEINCADGELSFSARIAAGIFLNINPSLIITELCEYAKLEMEYNSVKRLKVLTEDMTEFN